MCLYCVDTYSRRASFDPRKASLASMIIQEADESLDPQDNIPKNKLQQWMLYMNRNKTVIVFGVSRMCHQLSLIFFIVYCPDLMTRSGNMELSQAAKIIFFSGMSSSFGGPLVGYLIDRLSLNTVQLSACTLFCIAPLALVCHYFINTYALMVPVMVVIGVTYSIQSLTTPMIMIELTKDQSSLCNAMSLVHNFRLLGTIIGGYFFALLMDFKFEPVLLWSVWGIILLLAGTFTWLAKKVWFVTATTYFLPGR